MPYNDKVLHPEEVRHWRAGNGLRERPAKDLVRELLTESQALVREEVHLAKLELKEDAKRAGKGAGALGGAGVMGHTALLCFAACLIAALSGTMKVWVAALLVTALFAVLAMGLYFWGKERLTHLTPDQTMKTFKEDRQWMKDTLRRVRSRSPETT